MPRETDEYKASDCEKGLEKTFMDMMEKQGAKFVDVSDPYTCQVCGKKLKPAKECVNYSTNRNDLQYVSVVSNPAENRYILGQVDQKTLGIVFRIDYNITPELSVQP